MVTAHDRHATGVAEHALFDALYAEYKAPLYNYVYRLLGARESAEDVLQETFVKVYSALDRLPEGPGRSPWMYRIATNTCYDLLRRQRLLSWLPWVRAEDLPQPGPDDAVGDGYATHEEVQQALSLVPLALRAPLLLHAVQGFSYADIARTLGISEAAVKMRVSRARAAFRRAYRAGMERGKR